MNLTLFEKLFHGILGERGGGTPVYMPPSPSCRCTAPAPEPYGGRRARWSPDEHATPAMCTTVRHRQRAHFKAWAARAGLNLETSSCSTNFRDRIDFMLRTEKPFCLTRRGCSEKSDKKSVPAVTPESFQEMRIRWLCPEDDPMAPTLRSMISR